MESAIEARKSGAGLGEVISEGLLGAGIGAVGGALGYGLGGASLKILGKYAGKYAPSLTSGIRKSVDAFDDAIRVNLAKGYFKIGSGMEKVGRTIDSGWAPGPAFISVMKKYANTMFSGQGGRAPFYTESLAVSVSEEVIGETYEMISWYAVDKLWI